MEVLHGTPREILGWLVKVDCVCLAHILPESLLPYFVDHKFSEIFVSYSAGMFSAILIYVHMLCGFVLVNL
jgi:hypothetical protein